MRKMLKAKSRHIVRLGNRGDVFSKRGEGEEDVHLSILIVGHSQ